MKTQHVSREFRVLLIEDSPSDVRFVKEGFRTLGKPVSLMVMDDGQSALDYLKQKTGSERPDLVILDLNLPGMKGHDVLSAIREDERLTGLPVAIMSSSARPDDVKESYQRHANCHVTKPIDLDDYLKTIHDLGNFWFDTATLVGREQSSPRGVS